MAAQKFPGYPLTSKWEVAAEIRVHQNSVWGVLHTNKMTHSTCRGKNSKSKTTIPIMYSFGGGWLTSPQILIFSFLQATVLFSDKVSFTREGIFNTHNRHMWLMQNLHASVPWKSKERFKINVWAGIIEDYLLGLCILPGYLNGTKYHVFPELLQSVLATVQ